MQWKNCKNFCPKCKKWWNQTNKDILLRQMAPQFRASANKHNKAPLFLWFDPFINFWAEILTIFVAFLEKKLYQDFILKLSDL